MNVKNLFVSFLLLFLFTLFTPTALAEEKASASSATFAAILKTQAEDNRVKILSDYLQKHNSPMTPYASTFVAQADFYHLDWKLVASIAGVESTFGQAEPYNCYNGWGYGIYGDHMLCFSSYDEAIRTISKSLREQYMDKWGASDVYEIGHYYAASPTWAAHVTYFMDDIDTFRQSYDYNQPLSISL